MPAAPIVPINNEPPRGKRSEVMASIVGHM